MTLASEIGMLKKQQGNNWSKEVRKFKILQKDIEMSGEVLWI